MKVIRVATALLLTVGVSTAFSAGSKGPVESTEQVSLPTRARTPRADAEAKVHPNTLKLDLAKIRSLHLKGRILFFAHRDRFPAPPNAELYVADLTAGTIRRLTHTRNGNFDGRWSPDGRHIAFRSDRDAERSTPAFMDEIYTMNANGSAQTNITNSPATNDGWPAWSPDGTRLVFASDASPAEGTNLYTMRPDGADVSPLFASTQPDEEPDWSSRGEIVFKSNRSGDWELYALTASGQRLRRLTTSLGEDAAPRWSPDGRHIAFLSQHASRPSQTSVYVMTRDGDRKHAVTGSGLYGGPAWSPDGRYLAIPGEEALFVLDLRRKGSKLVRVISGEVGSGPDWHR